MLLISSHLRISYDLPVIWGPLCEQEKSTTCFTHGLGEQRSPSAGASGRVSLQVFSEGFWNLAGPGLRFQFRSLAAVGSISEFQKHFEPWIFPICKMRKIFLISISYCAVRIKSRTRGKCFAQAWHTPQKCPFQRKVRNSTSQNGTKLTQFALLQVKSRRFSILDTTHSVVTTHSAWLL